MTYSVCHLPDGRIVREAITVPAGASLTAIGLLADQDGWTGGTLWVSQGGKIIAVEDESFCSKKTGQTKLIEQVSPR